MLSFYKWSGDYPGFAQLELEKAHPGAVALFWAGCGGDQNPLPRRKVELAEKYGKELVAAVEAVLTKPMKAVAGALATSYTEVALPFADLPLREQLVKESASSNRYLATRRNCCLRNSRRRGRCAASIRIRSRRGSLARGRRCWRWAARWWSIMPCV